MITFTSYKYVMLPFSETSILSILPMTIYVVQFSSSSIQFYTNPVPLSLLSWPYIYAHAACYTALRMSGLPAAVFFCEFFIHKEVFYIELKNCIASYRKVWHEGCDCDAIQGVLSEIPSREKLKNFCNIPPLT